MDKEKKSSRKKGFSLLESLISMSLFLLIILFSLDCFSVTRKHFCELKSSEEANTAVYAALDRMRKDIQEAGSGLIEAIRHDLLAGIRGEDGVLTVLSKESELWPTFPLVAGQQRIPVKRTADIKRGKLICVIHDNRGEVHPIAEVNKKSLVLGSPLNSDFGRENTHMVLMRKVSLYLDENRGVLRRKVNASPGQPLLEEVASFCFDINDSPNLIRISLRLRKEEENEYELWVYPKNTAMASF